MRRLSLLGVLLATAAGAAALSAGVVSARSATRPAGCVEDPVDCGLPPEITGVSATRLRATSVRLRASIESGSQTSTWELFIRYAPCQGGAGECPKPVQTEKVASGAIAGSTRAKRVAEKVTMLTPSCGYEYWFVAHNERGAAESEHEVLRRETGGPKECRR